MLDLAPHVLRILSEFDGHILLEPLNFAPLGRLACSLHPKYLRYNLSKYDSECVKPSNIIGGRLRPTVM